MKTNYYIFLIAIFTAFAISCTKSKVYQEEWDPNKVKGYNNENYYSSVKMDSIQSILHITKQKLQEVYDLALLASQNRANKAIDTLLLSQIQGYFAKGDTLYANDIVRSLDSIKAKYVKIELLDNPKYSDSLKFTDSIGIVNFKIDFYNERKKLFSTKDRQAEYILKMSPAKFKSEFKSEFKFYFSSIGKLKQ